LWPTLPANSWTQFTRDSASRKGTSFRRPTSPETIHLKYWVNKGDWLALAKKVGAEKLFFVENYPVIVFAEQTTQDPTEWLRWFNSVWCMARPQLLFLAREGELCVFNLTRQPARRGEEPGRNRRLLETVRVAAPLPPGSG